MEPMKTPLQPVGGSLRQESITMPAPAYVERAYPPRRSASTKQSLQDRIDLLEMSLEIAVERAEMAESLLLRMADSENENLGPEEVFSAEDIDHLLWLMR